MDLLDNTHRDVEKTQKAIHEQGLRSFPVSALTGEGIEDLKRFMIEEWVQVHRERTENMREG